MKLTFKLFGVIVLFAVIAFSFAACGDGGGNSMNNDTDSDPLTKPSFKVEAEIATYEGSTLLFSKKPVRAQWNIGDDSLYNIAFVFPINTKIAQKRNGEFVLITASSEYQSMNRIFPIREYGKLRYEITLNNDMGKEAYGIRISSTDMGIGLLPIYINGVTERAVNPGDSIMYVWDIDPSKPKPTDDKTLAKFREPSRSIQSNAPEIVALAKTITNGINSDYEKARAIHQWVAGNIWYNYDGVNKDAVFFRGEESWYSTFVLRNKLGVCEGYARLTAALLRAVGIPSKETGGYTGSTGHAWNEAYADARWINMDTTWDSNNRYENGKFSPKQAPGNQWFDVPDNEFSKTHKSTGYAEYILKNGLAATEV